MTKKISRVIGLIMLLIAIVFVIFAATHPEMGFAWSNAITYFLYCVYLFLMAILLIAPFREKKRYISKDL